MISAITQATWWNQAPADWAENERLSIPVYNSVFNLMGVAPGQRLLDVGCGAGTALRVAANRGFRTAGLDAASALVEIARVEVPEADVRVGELESLPFGNGDSGDGFDVVTFFNALQYGADPVAALGEARRVAKPGAVVTALTWGEVSRCESRIAMGALRALAAPTKTSSVGAPAGGPFALSTPGRLVELFAAAGIAAISEGEIPVSFRYTDLEAAIRLQMASGPARRTVEEVGERAVREALHTAMTASRRANGSYAQANVFRYLVGRT